MFCAQCGQWLSEGEAVCSRCGAPVHGGAAGVSAPALPEPATAVHPPSVAHAADAMIPGGFWRRFASGIVDTLVLFFPTAIVRVLSGMDAWGSGNPMDAALLRAGVINLLLYWLYCAVSSPPAPRGRSVSSSSGCACATTGCGASRSCGRPAETGRNGCRA